MQTANGDEVAWTEGTHYTLTGAGEEEGGTLAVLTIPVDHTPQPGEVLVIKRAVPETQLTELPLGGTLPSTTIEQMVDLVTMMVQAHSEEIARSVLLKATSQASGIEIPDPEASKFLRWDDAAQNLENADIVAGGAISIPVPVSQGGTNATTAAGARTNLDVPGLSVANTFTKTQTWTKGADVASAGALTLGDGNYFDVTGTTAITSIATKGVGTVIKLHFDAALTLTHHATDLILPGGANITTAAGDEAEFVEYATGDWRCTDYQRASASPISSGFWTPVLTFATPGDLNVAYSSQVGGYIKTGDMVVVTAIVTTSTFTHSTASGSLLITGLPFTAEDVASQQWYGAVRWQGITKANYTDLVARINNNTSRVDFFMSGSGQANDVIDEADTPTGGTVLLHFTITYKAA